MGEMRKKRVETIVAWVGYSAAFIGLTALLLSLFLPCSNHRVTFRDERKVRLEENSVQCILLTVCTVRASSG